MSDVLLAVFFTAMIGAWLTHVVVCLLNATYVLLLVGTFVFPVGIIHGIGIWFGVNW